MGDAAEGVFCTQRPFGHTRRQRAEVNYANAAWVGERGREDLLQALSSEGAFKPGLQTAYRELGSQAHLSLYWQVLPLHLKEMGESHQKMCCAFCSILWDSMALLLLLRKMP